MIAKYFARSFAMLKVVSEPRVINICFPVSTTSMSFVGLESRSTMLPASLAAWVPVFMGGRGAVVLPPPHISLRKRRSVVRAVAGHRDQAALRLVTADECEFGFRSGLGQEIIHARLGCNRRRGERVVAGDHDRLDAHAAQLAEALFDAAFDDVFQLDDAEDTGAVAYQQGRAAATCDLLQGCKNVFGKCLSRRLDLLLNGGRSTLTNLA